MKNTEEMDLCANDDSDEKEETTKDVEECTECAVVLGRRMLG